MKGTLKTFAFVAAFFAVPFAVSASTQIYTTGYASGCSGSYCVILDDRYGGGHGTPFVPIRDYVADTIAVDIESGSFSSAVGFKLHVYIDDYHESNDASAKICETETVAPTSVGLTQLQFLDDCRFSSGATYYLQLITIDTNSSQLKFKHVAASDGQRYCPGTCGVLSYTTGYNRFGFTLYGLATSGRAIAITAPADGYSTSATTTALTWAWEGASSSQRFFVYYSRDGGPLTESASWYSGSSGSLSMNLYGEGVVYAVVSFEEILGGIVPIAWRRGTDFASVNVYFAGSSTSTLSLNGQDCGGVLGTIKCALIWAFVPSDDSLNELKSLTLANSSPFGYVYDVPDVYDDVLAATGTPWELSIDFSTLASRFGPTATTGTIVVFSTCAVNNAFGEFGGNAYTTYVLPMLAACMWFGLAFMIYTTAHRYF